MIVFKINGNNGEILGLGLTRENIQKLREGLPILVDKSRYPVPQDIIITYGDTIEDILDDMQSFIGPDTIIDNT